MASVLVRGTNSPPPDQTYGQELTVRNAHERIRRQNGSLCCSI